MRHLFLVLAGFVLIACGNPKDTAIPRDVTKLETIKPALDKLTQEERELVTAYIVRQELAAKLGGLFGGKAGPGISEGMTIGKALEEQRKFVADAKAEEARQQALKEKLAAEREAALKPMREAVTVTLVSKRVSEDRGMSGMVLDEKLEVTFGYSNNSSKDIAGVKGRVTVKDMFGDEISAFQISNDNTIKAGASSTWTGSRSLRFYMGGNKDRKLAELPDDKYKVDWDPQVIVFSDGTRLASPDAK